MYLKRVLSFGITCLLLLQMLPTAFAVSSTTEVGRIVVSFSRGTLSVGDNERPITTETEVKYDTVSAALNDLSDGSLSTKLGSKDAIYKLDPEYPCKVLIDARTNNTTYEETISPKIIISADTSEDVINTADDQVIQVNFPEIEMAVANLGFTTSAHKIIFAGGLEVQSGASLVLDNNARNTAGTTITYTFTAPVTVSGSLKFDGNAAELGDAGGTSGPVTFSDDATLTVANGGEVIVGGVAVTGDATSPLFKVEEGGKLDFTSAGASSYSTIETSGTAIEVAGGEVSIDTGKINATGDKPAITVGKDAELTISGGEITGSSGQPAIDAANGATVVIPEDSKAEIKSEGGNAAIDLAGGAKVQQGKNDAITVASLEGDDSASNYVDNHGNIVLQSGSEDGKVAPNTVIQPDGTAISGKNDLPTVDSEGNVTVPEGGATVTNPDGESVEVPEGGELNDIYIGVSEGDGSDTLKTSATIVAGQTLDLQAVSFNNANLSNYECSVESSDSNVATAEVTDDGITVTAKGVGSATITATFTPKAETRMLTADDGTLTAQFKVTVTEAPIAVTGVTLNNTSLSLYEGNTYQLTATVEPANAANKTVTWNSSNSGVATVASNGKVTAVSSGTATITVTTEDGNKTATCTVTVSRASSGGGSSDDDDEPTYNVALPSKVTGGDIKVTPRNAEKGETVTITVDPDKGYELDKLVITDRKGKELDLTEKADNKFTFKMPASRVDIEVSFRLIETEPENPFTDISKSDYFYDAVLWAVEQGITSGTSDTTFSPNASCTRAQMVTFLWRANGSPKASGVNPFTDVSADAYYYDAVLWAAEKGITSGTSDTTFSPDAVLTRGQTVTFLWRANGSPAVSGGSFSDVAADAYYASAVAWAVSEGVTSGTGGNSFSPDADCTRGQIVTFMYRDAT